MPEKTLRSRKQRQATADELITAANQYLVPNYPFGCLAGPPRDLLLGSRDLWIVPVLLTSPGIGAVDEVGVIALDADNAQVVGETPREEVAAAVKRLREDRHHELEAAFRRPKKA